MRWDLMKKVIGLTGSIATGKSTVSNKLKRNFDFFKASEKKKKWKKEERG